MLPVTSWRFLDVAVISFRLQISSWYFQEVSGCLLLFLGGFWMLSCNAVSSLKHKHCPHNLFTSQKSGLEEEHGFSQTICCVSGP